MKKIKIQIANKVYEVELAETEQQQEEGLQGRSELKENAGMLFIFDENESRSFWMKDTEIPLDVIFINVLELNQDSGVKVGDELDFEPENKKIKKTDKMLVLDSGGEVQMELDGGERIFSRAHTKTLIKFAKKAATTNNENDYKALGKRMFKFLQVQSETDPEYVESKN